MTHTNADFDALSSQVAAQKLYPKAKIVLGRVSRPVRDFLALHKERFPAVTPKEIDLDAVERLILVDVRRPDRLKDYAPLLERASRGELEVVIYDHHPSSIDDVVGAVEVIEPVGSA
ncbi:MAG: DHH family phosphoesterase, partial [Myxococcota bacterium]